MKGNGKKLTKEQIALNRARASTAGAMGQDGGMEMLVDGAKKIYRKIKGKVKKTAEQIRKDYAKAQAFRKANEEKEKTYKRLTFPKSDKTKPTTKF